ncbi:AAA family ATPase [Rhizobium laguerreae]|uniref:ATP-dependent nuclease n=1 Tax=Rhizobium laguerreae TaxID=1076926 RepID=UPI001C916883|nr:AAA family ATPase [Rhizobium laguerreae]MBY3186058.1 AAA family ATPase [Rhizobium laguerreae]
MFLSKLEISNFRHFGDGANALVLELNNGITALVGENDAGKTAIVDAIRMVLGTRDQEYLRVQPSDFHFSIADGTRAEQITICCTFSDLTPADRGAFVEHLSYSADAGPPLFQVNWIAKRQEALAGSRRYNATEWRSGIDGEGPIIDPGARALLTATYLRPLRDAERALSAGRGSRLAQILQNTREITAEGASFDKDALEGLDPKTLSLLGLADYTNHHFQENEGIKKTKARLDDDFLEPLSFVTDKLTAHISVNGNGDDSVRLRQVLEKLDVIANAPGVTDGSLGRGLGSNNILFMACELLLLAGEEDGFPLLIIEEPEAHLHPQRQLRLMDFLQSQVEKVRPDGQSIQIIVTTHSPNLASEISLQNISLLKDRKAFLLAKGKTLLTDSDYPFLERYLDVTKSNLFFARGVIVVEGPAENILVPTLADLLGRNLERYGVSLIDVKGTGLGRFARILQRSKPEVDGEIGIPVSCITDMDVMPDCAPWLVGILKEGDPFPPLQGSRRKWRAKRDFPGDGLVHRRATIEARASGQRIRTFVANEWTLEYDLAFFGLAEYVWIAADLADNDDALLVAPETFDAKVAQAKSGYSDIAGSVPSNEQLCSKVYARFAKDGVSKAISAQYLASILADAVGKGDLTPAGLSALLPPYLLAAIEHVTAPFEGAA